MMGLDTIDEMAVASIAWAQPAACRTLGRSILPEFAKGMGVVLDAIEGTLW
jgi:hypothetical protein